jgi:hypothetical protein
MSAAAPATPGPAASGDAPTTDRDLGLIVATTDGTAKCESLFATGESVTVLTDQPGSIYASADGTKACSIQGRIGILGSRDLVKAAIAAHAGHNGVDATTAYRTARDTLGGDRLATVYVSKAGLAASLRVGGGAGALASAMPLASGGLGAALAAIPEWTMGGVSAEDDALVADLVSAPVTAPSASADGGSPLPSLPPAHASRTATLVPADTLALVDVHGAGIALRTGIARLRADPTLGAALGQVDTTLAALGGADQLVAWVEDAGIAVVPDGPGATGGVLLLATDDASATTKVAQVKSLLSLAGLGGTQIQVHDETVAGTTMTVVDLGDLGSLLQGLGAGSAVPLPAGQHVTVAFAAKGPAVIAGGDAFVRATLGLAAGGSLADAAPYRHAIGRAAAENLGEVYVGTSSLLALADTLLPEAQRASFDTDTKPYLEPFDAILVTTTLERGGAHVRLVATVK